MAVFRQRFVLSVIAISVCISLQSPYAFAQAMQEGPVDAKELQEENTQLRAINQRLAKENADLRVESSKLKDSLAKAGIDVPNSPQAITQVAATQSTVDGNSTVAKAINTCCDTVAAISGAGDTDIQKRQKWLAAVKTLGEVLANHRVVINYTINDVTFDEKSGTARITVSSATIKSTDADIGDVTFQRFFNTTISAGEAQAAKITTGSQMTLEGTLRLGVLIDKPAAEQPALIGQNELSGFKAVGWVKGPTSPRYEMPCFFIQNNAVLQIDGLTRKASPPAPTTPGIRGRR